MCSVDSKGVVLLLQMDVQATARQLWLRSGLPVPSVLLGHYAGKWYVTTSDDSSICYFASAKGKIYVAIKTKCQVAKSGDLPDYVINEPGALQVISCNRPITAA